MMLLLATLAGVNIVFTRFLNAECAKKNSLSVGTLFNYITGLLTSIIVLILSGEPGGFRSDLQTSASLFIYLGGTVGVMTLLLSNYLTPRLPAFLLTLLIFISQLLTALLLDFVITGELSMGKLIGGLLVFVGLWHYGWVHKTANK